jgi:hypothetical protein
MRNRTLLLALVLGAGDGLLFGQIPESERIPITDPDRLQRMGLPRDAKNVFEWTKLDRGDGAVLGRKTAQTWGSQTGFTTVLGSELLEETDEMDMDRASTGEATCTDEAYSFLGGAWANVRFDLPEGASLATFNSWAFDANPDRDFFFQVYEVCQEYGYGDPVTTLIAENSTLGAIGAIPGSKSLGGLTVNNHDCAYTVRVTFAIFGQDCTVDLRIRKLQFTWNRQVSPPPATATFNDVPTSHLFFPFIEALAKSEITGGCGGSNYCPDEPLTRGQMAVFLAKALGLQWP